MAKKVKSAHKLGTHLSLHFRSPTHAAMTALQIPTEGHSLKKPKKSQEEKDARKLEKRRKRELEAEEADPGGLYVLHCTALNNLC